MIPPLPGDLLLTGVPALVLSAFLGLIFGSFASALTYRIPRRIGWGRARSACPSCGQVLGVRDLVPLLSWLALRGRCRYCRAAIGVRYPLIEAATMVLCMAVAVLYGIGLPGLVLMLAMPFLIALLAIDIDHMILPDQLNIILFVLGVVYVFAFDPFGIEIALMGSVLYAGLLWVTGWLMRLLLKRDSVGFGDVKFFAVAGVWLGPAMLPLFLCLSGVMGVVFGVIWKKLKGGVLFPFGPALIASFILCLLAGDRIMALFAGF